MQTDTLIEQRLTTVEKAVGELQRQLANLPSGPHWLDQITGSFKDEPAFEEVLEFEHEPVGYFNRAWSLRKTSGISTACSTASVMMTP